MHRALDEQHLSWKACTKQEICIEHMSDEMYRPVTTNAEFFQNWIQKYDLLCMPKACLGFFASCFFLGIMVAIYFVPSYSDANGRLLVIFASIALQLFAQLGLLLSDSIYFGYFCMFCIGTTFPGKNIILYNYAMEILQVENRQLAVNLVAGLESLTVLACAFYYQYLSINWIYLHYCGTLMTVVGLFFVVCFLPESPKFLYSKGRFNEARDSLRAIARFNGFSAKDDFEFVFDTEIVNVDPLNCSRDALFIPNASNSQGEDIAEHFDSNAHALLETTSSPSDETAATCSEEDLKAQMEKNYNGNLLRMTIMWSASSFCCYLLVFLNKYLEGSIFVNNYYEGVATLISVGLGASIYARLGKRRAFSVAFALAILGGTLIYLLESGHVDFPESFLASFSGSPKARRLRAVAYLVPKVTFIAKFGVGLAFLCCYQASFSDETLFPSETRATAIGTCQFIARGLTTLAPEICELAAPQPIEAMIFASVIAFATSWTFVEIQAPPKTEPTQRQELRTRLQKKLDKFQ